MRPQGRNGHIQRLIDADRRWSALMSYMTESHKALYWSSAILAHAGDGLVWLFIGAGVLVVGAPADRAILARIAASAAVAALCVTALKFGVRRQRPASSSARWSALPRHDLYSFPSGHAARVACIAVGVSAVHPLAGLPLFLWAVGVCLARVMLAAHYLLDVMVGLVLGTAVSMAVSEVWPTLLRVAGELPL